MALDLSAVGQADSAGAAAVAALLDEAGRQGARLDLAGLSPAMSDRLRQTPAEPARSEVEAPGVFEKIGAAAGQAWEAFIQVLLFHADVAIGVAAGFFSSRFRRQGAVARDALAIGTDALPVVGTIAFLLGLILAFQGGHLMKEFGTTIFVADLVGRGMTREFAPLLTAIVVAGRSGAAIAAEIGAMKTNEELDALTVIGIEPARYLVVPKLYAITFTQPLLAILASGISILGGFLIAVFYLQLGPDQYFDRILETLKVNDVFNCLFKSVVFGWLIVLIGAYQGFRVQGGAEGVGRAATRAVVAAIFAIIFADGIITTIDTLTG